MSKNDFTLVRSFLDDGVCLIVEPSAPFASSLQTCLIELGVPLSQVITAKKFADAERIINESKPKLIITEYELDGNLGLALIDLQAKYLSEMQRVSIVATKNSSDSAVAEAAEEQVDVFILKPFSVDTFRTKVSEVVQRKLKPSPYIQKIQEGKIHYANKAFDQAVVEFLAAKPLDKKPTLACFYAGNTLQELGKRTEAMEQFREGRKYSPLHYKCLIGEFEGLMNEKKYPEAYELVPLIHKNYPITSKRLGQIFIAAVFTHHFDDLPHYYQLYLKIEQRPPELVKLTSMALLTAGRFAIQRGENSKAVEYFDMGVMATAKQLQFIERVISELIKIKASQQAQLFLAKVSSGDVGTAAYNQLSYRVDELVLNKTELIERGRKLILAGEGTPIIFESVIKLMAEAGKITLAETMIGIAVQAHPKMRDALYAMLEGKKDDSAA